MKSINNNLQVEELEMLEKLLTDELSERVELKFWCGECVKFDFTVYSGLFHN